MSDDTSELPSGWTEAFLPELLGKDGLFTDGDWVESKDQDENGGIRLIQLADVGDGIYRNRSSRFLTREKAVELGCTILKVDDLLISRMADPLGRACLFPGDEKPSATVVDVCIVRVGKGAAEPNWLVHAVNSPIYRRELDLLASGTTRRRISRANLGTAPIPLPPLPEQRRIVSKIEALQARSRKAREALEAIPPLLEQFRQSVLAAAFRGDLTADWREQHPDVEPAGVLLERIRAERRRKWEEAELAKFKERQKLPPTRWDEKYQEPPKHLTERHLKSELEAIPSTWCVTNLETISELITGTTPSTSDEENWNGDIPFISPSDVHPRGHILIPKRTVTKLGASKARVIQSNTVLIVCIGTIGKVGFLDRTAVFNQQMNALVPCQFVIPRLLFYWCRHLKQWLAEEASATVNAAIINKTRLGLAPFVLPPLEEQILLAKLLDAAFYTADDIERRTSENLSEVSNLDQSILAKAFLGELVPQDPDDEHASVLLQRIQAERANDTNGKPPRGRRKNSNS